MVYFATWDEFFEASTRLFLEHQQHTRYTVKYRPAEQKVVLTVTNDVQLFKFKTDQANDMKLIEKLNKSFCCLMSAPQPTVDLLIDDEKKPEEKPMAAAKSKGRR